MKRDTKKIGNLGEDIASRYFVEKGFSILARNYMKKWGEIDIIAQKVGQIHFIEVKSVSRENLDGVIHETSSSDNKEKLEDGYRAEENVHPKKLERLGRTIQTYLLENDMEDREWQLDVVTVLIDQVKKQAKVHVIKDIII